MLGNEFSKLQYDGLSNVLIYLFGCNSTSRGRGKVALSSMTAKTLRLGECVF